jgi:hypothetical protein
MAIRLTSKCDNARPDPVDSLLKLAELESRGETSGSPISLPKVKSAKKHSQTTAIKIYSPGHHSPIAKRFSCPLLQRVVA